MAYDSCSSCGRHVKRADTICPFCGAMRVAGTARFTRSAARPPSSISRAQWLALGSAVVSTVVLSACKDSNDAGDGASSRESGPSNEAPIGVDGTTGDAAPMASGADAAPGGWLTPEKDESRAATNRMRPKRAIERLSIAMRMASIRPSAARSARRAPPTGVSATHVWGRISTGMRPPATGDFAVARA